MLLTGVNESVPDLEEHEAGGGDDVETVDVVPERDVEPLPVVSVTEHVGLPTDALRLPADDDDGLPVAGETGQVPVLDGL